MKKGLFVTGTGTDVGKTVVTAGVLRWLREKGVDAIVSKPVQTGGIPCAEGFRAPDLAFALEVAGLEPSAEEMGLMSPYCYEPACSPHLAGRMAGSYPEIGRICECIDALSRRHDFVLVEGAGGVMVPLDESTTTLDLMRALGLPVLLVAHTGLGTINHTLLSIEVLRAAGLDVFGVVFNGVADVDGEAFISADNPPMIAKFGKVDVLGNVRHLHLAAPSAAEPWKNFKTDVPGLSRILQLARES